MAGLNDRNDKFVCPECGASCYRWQVESVFRSSDGKGAKIVAISAAPLCEHKDGSRWEMQLNPPRVIRR